MNMQFAVWYVGPKLCQEKANKYPDRLWQIVPIDTGVILLPTGQTTRTKLAYKQIEWIKL